MVVLAVSRSAGQMGLNGASGEVEAELFPAERGDRHTFSGVHTHVEAGGALRHRVGLITSGARLRFRLVLAEWTPGEATGLAVSCCAQSCSHKPYVSQMPPA